MRLPRKQKVVSSNLTGGSFFFRFRTATDFKISVRVKNILPQGVPVAQLDKAPDYESGDWGFKSLLGYFLRLVKNSFATSSKNTKPRSTGFEPATPRFEV